MATHQNCIPTISRNPSGRGNTTHDFEPTGFIVKKKLCVYIYKHNINALKVDAIVRQDNPHRPFPGKTFTIPDISIAKGELPEVEQVTNIGADHRPCKFILHVAGPLWKEHGTVDSKSTLIEQLRLTYLNIFEKAEKLGCTSIACPLIENSGGMPIPLHDVAGIMIDTIISLDLERIEEVHLVGENNSKLLAIHEAFQSIGAVPHGEGRVRHAIKRTIQIISPSDINGLKSEPSYRREWSFHFQPVGYICRNTSIYVHMCDMTDLLLDAFVNTTNEYFTTGFGLSRTITEKGGPTIVEACNRIASKQRKLNFGQVVRTEGGQLSAGHVLHAVIPFWVTYIDKHDLRSYLDKLKDTFYSLMEEVKKHGITSIAIPPIGSGDGTISQAVDTMCQVLKEAIEEGSSLQQVHLVDTSGGMLEIIGSILESLSLQPISVEEVERRIARVKTKSSIIANVTPHITPNPIDNSDMNTMIGNPTDQERSRTDDHNTITKKTELDRNTCVICLDEIVNPEILKCKHTFCKPCISHLFETYTPKCPSCGLLHGVAKGNQPEGKMRVTLSDTELQGHEGHGSIWIDYTFNNGIQGENHPNPGKQYMGSARTAFLPDTEDGRRVLKLLEKAFEARLIFTIGRSVTTGCDNVVTWNDVHHKTSIDGGPTEYGYPDPTYLTRVKDELAAKGIM